MMSIPPTAAPSLTPDATDLLLPDPDNTPGYTPAFNFFFLLIIIAGLLIFCSLLFFGRRHKSTNAASISRSGRAALAQDVESWNGRRTGRWAFRVAPYPSFTSRGRIHSPVVSGRSGNGGLTDEEAAMGLNERGEAPPPYGADKPPPRISSSTSVHSEMAMEAVTRNAGDGGSNGAARPPPLYEQSLDLEEGMGVVTRPPVAVTAMERAQ